MLVVTEVGFGCVLVAPTRLALSAWRSAVVMMVRRALAREVESTLDLPHLMHHPLMHHHQTLHPSRMGLHVGGEPVPGKLRHVGEVPAHGVAQHGPG